MNVIKLEGVQEGESWTQPFEDKYPGYFVDWDVDIPCRQTIWRLYKAKTAKEITKLADYYPIVQHFPIAEFRFDDMVFHTFTHINEVHALLELVFCDYVKNASET